MNQGYFCLEGEYFWYIVFWISSVGIFREKWKKKSSFKLYVQELIDIWFLSCQIIDIFVSVQNDKLQEQSLFVYLFQYFSLSVCLYKQAQEALAAAINI